MPTFQRCCRRRLDLWWRPLPVVVMPLTAILVREGHSWILIDAGAPDSWSQGYASRLVQAVQATLPKGDSLQAILCERLGAQAVAAGACSCCTADTPNLRPADPPPLLLSPNAPPLPAACTPACNRTAAVTHAHFDHVGAIPQLLKLYPQALVVVHSKEAPFLMGQHPAGQQQYSSRSAVLLRLLQAAAVVPRGPIQVSRVLVSAWPAQRSSCIVLVGS